jgi:type II secretory pathway pseudopilin PulG
MRNSNFKSSFTIVELVVCLFIIGVISAVTLPYCWGAYRSAEAKTTTRIIASILRSTKEKAQAQGKKYEIIFTPSDNNLEIEVYTNLSDPTPLKVGKTEKISLSNSYEFNVTFHNDKAIFTSFGTSNGGSVYITDISSSKGYRISVLSTSARVKVLRF